MPVIIDKRTKSKEIKKGVFRKLGYLDTLMTAIIDFTDGPMNEPETPHQHSHEQISYVAEGSLYVFIGDEKHHLEKGDVFIVPSNMPHSIQTITEKVRLVDSFSPIRTDFLNDKQ